MAAATAAQEVTAGVGAGAVGAAALTMDAVVEIAATEAAVARAVALVQGASLTDVTNSVYQGANNGFGKSAMPRQYRR